MNATPLLVGRGLHKSYRQTPALRGVDLSVAAGEVLAVMGTSGAGKSTLLQCVAGVVTPDTGEVHFDGRRIDRLPDRERTRLRRSDFGCVFQFGFGKLVPDLSVLENIALPLLLTGRRRRAAVATAREWVPRLCLEGIEHRLPGEIPAEQGQRVAIARALIAGPRVIFADEPTGPLSLAESEQMTELLVDTAKDAGASVILVTHKEPVAAYADRQVTVRDGRIVHPVMVS